MQKKNETTHDGRQTRNETKVNYLIFRDKIVFRSTFDCGNPILILHILKFWSHRCDNVGVRINKVAVTDLCRLVSSDL